MTPPLPDCARCGDPADWHRLDSAQNVGPCDPRARFRCVGYDCESDGPIPEDRCTCPDYIGPAEVLVP